ncbi:uncharacterized protein CXorf58 homolog [Rhineura floridana]|uniref:uncharacterized protein CXorf58 homolog n=1 Tax=Rhineura floridana TaxID=261503 RepID=UPI002AC8667B|nr:uncharacterized protein CXorf58 homolog [Rhineura floridana]
MWGSIHTIVPKQDSTDWQRAQQEAAAKTIQKTWWIHIRIRLFKLLKHTIRAAEHCISYEILKRVSPLEAELLNEPTIKCKVRFRFAGSDFPPFIVFKIFCKSGGQSNHYISGKRVITSTSEAAVDACKLMGYRKYYNQMLQDELQYKKYGITDEIDVATIRDYIQYASLMDETPAYFGGRHNYWRRLSLENLPRAMIMYDIMDYAQSGKLSTRLRMELPFLLLRPQNEETCCAQVMAVCQIRSPTPCPTTATLSKLDRRSLRRTAGRRSYQAHQKAAKMKKAYRSGKEREMLKSSSFVSDHSESTSVIEGPSHESLLSDEDWEQEAVRLYDWARSLRTEDIGED